MAVNQLSVFIENREGRLEEVTSILANEQVNIVTLSLADTAEYGMLRMIVSEPEKAKDALKAAGFVAKLTPVLAIKVPNCAGMLQKILHTVAEAGCNVEYMYILSTGANASVIVKASDVEKAQEAMKNAGIELYDAEEVYNFVS